MPLLKKKAAEVDRNVYIGTWVECPDHSHGHHSGEVLRKTWLGHNYTGVEAELSCGHVIVWWF